jgi:hypothetical protein
VLFSNANIPTKDDQNLDEMFQYVIDVGWISLGKSPVPINALQQNGVLILNDDNLSGFESLDMCATTLLMDPVSIRGLLLK